jgi:hypothetical protein
MKTSPSILRYRYHKTDKTSVQQIACPEKKHEKKMQNKVWIGQLCCLPERATRGWHVERHEPADADGLAWLLQLHYVLQHQGRKTIRSRNVGSRVWRVTVTSKPTSFSPVLDSCYLKVGIKLMKNDATSPKIITSMQVWRKGYLLWRQDESLVWDGEGKIRHLQDLMAIDSWFSIGARETLTELRFASNWLYQTLSAPLDNQKILLWHN